MPRPGDGGAFRYVGRSYDPTAEGDKYPVSTTPYECEPGTGEALYLARECRDGALVPADKATADALGLALKDPKPARVAKDGS